MESKKQEIIGKIYNFIRKYAEMEINGSVINCPYWVNKLKNKQVKIRGFLDGKGSAKEIRNELMKRLYKYPYRSLDSEFVRKFARRERIGIDCSGFAYRVIDKLVHFHYRDCSVFSLDDIFTGGINKTNADTLTQNKYSIQIRKAVDFQLGDLIRISGGKHVLVILEFEDSQIIYAHSSHLTTKTAGVHFGTIRTIDKEKDLESQIWLEETRRGENYGERYFDSQKGDGVYRLKIFD